LIRVDSAIVESDALGGNVGSRVLGEDASDVVSGILDSLMPGETVSDIVSPHHVGLAARWC
jgi:hypothetical protein